METLKIGFFILGSAASLGFIIFFLFLIFNKDNGIDLEQGRINYLSREIDRLEKKIDESKSEDRYNIWRRALSNNLPLLLPDCKFSQNGAVEYARKLENENERLKKTIEDTEKRRTEAYDLIANVYEFQQTIMPTYGIYKAEAIDISELETELESSFREYFRREKLIKNKASLQDVTINTNRNVE